MCGSHGVRGRLAGRLAADDAANIVEELRCRTMHLRMTGAVGVPAIQLGFIANEQILSVDVLHEPERAEGEVVDEVVTIRPLVKQQQHPLAVSKHRHTRNQACFVAQHTARLMNLDDDAGRAFEHVLDDDVGDRLDAEVRRLLHMRAEHVTDDDRVRPVDLESIRRDHIGRRKPSSCDEHKQQRRQTDSLQHRSSNCQQTKTTYDLSDIAVPSVSKSL